MKIANRLFENVSLRKGPSKVDASLSSPEDGIGTAFRNIGFSSYLEF
jgi:hypothetical protein